MSPEKQPPPVVSEEGHKLFFSQAILENTTDAIFWMEPNGKFLDVNPAACRIYGYSRQELLRMGVADIAPDLKNGVPPEMAEATRIAGYGRAESVHVRKDGSSFPCEILVVYVEREGTAYHCGFVRDITERKKLERDLQKRTVNLERAQSMAHLGNWELDLASGKMIWSDQMYSILGHEPGGVTPCAEALLAKVPADERPKVESLISRAWESSFPLEATFRMYRAGGMERYMRIITEPGVNDKMSGQRLFGAMQDVTESKRTEQELTKARNAAERASNLKDKFMALISHDLRSPLASISLMLEMLDRDTNLQGTSREMVGRMKNGSMALINLIDELLNISRLKMGHLTPIKTRVNARIMADDALASSAHQAENKDINLVNHIPADVVMFADRTLAGELLANLVSNAVKFTRNGGTITISQPCSFCIAVEDNGVGINPEILPHIFSSEVKTTSMGTAGEKGTGLGLPYCHEIAKAHGGELTVQSELGKGSIFSLTLPPHEVVILLADDQEAHRNIMKEMLKDVANAEYLEAESGTQAMAALQDCVPDLIITDVAMPEMDGLELVSKARSMPAISQVPILMVSSYESSPTFSQNIREKAAQAGGDHFVQKPLIREEFVAAARDLLAGKAKAAQARELRA